MQREFYTFPAILSYDVPGEVGVIFPDIPGCTGQCKDNVDVVAYAREVLTFHLETMIENREKIPEPSAVQDIKAAPDEKIVGIRTFI